MTRPFLVVATLATLPSLARPAHAQQTARDTTRLDPVVVTATRLPVPRSAVPSSVTVLEGSELAGRGVRLVADALRQVPGLAVVQGGSPGATASVFLRGGESDYVKILVDGVPVNVPGGSFDWANLTTDNVERIEVVRGPSSVLYGSDAVTGVVQIFTRRGRGGPVASAGVEAGSMGTVRWGADVAGGAERVEYSAELARFATSGALPVNNAYDNFAGSARLQVRPDDRSDVALSVRGGDATSRFPTDGGGAIADSNQFTTLRSTTVSLDAGRHLTDRVEARVLAGLYAATSGFDDLPDNAADTTGFGYASRRRGTVRRSTLDGRANVALWRGATLTAGLTFEEEREEQTSQATSNFGDGPSSSTGAFDAERTNLGAYAQAMAPLGRGAILTAGARLDDNEVFGNFATWRAGVSVPLPTGTRLRLSAGNSFKAPTFSEQFAASAFEIGNPDLDPEHATSWEAAVEQTLAGGRVTLVAAAFGQRFRDLIQYSFVDAGTPSYVNIAEATSDGLEAEVRARPHATLDLSASMTWLDTEVVDAGVSTGNGVPFVEGATLVRRPSRSAAASVRWRPASPLALGVAVSHVGARDDVDYRPFPSVRVTLPSYTLWDLDASAEIVAPAARRPRVTATVRLQNAFDAAYAPIVGFAAPGRVALVGVRVGG